MVRIKQTTFRNAVAAKVPKKRIAKRISTKSDSMIRGTTAAPDPKRKASKRKTKPYEKINREIKRLQMSTDLIFAPKAVPTVKDILNSIRMAAKEREEEDKKVPVRKQPSRAAKKQPVDSKPAAPKPAAPEHRFESICFGSDS